MMNLVRAGYDVDMISPHGGKAPLDGVMMDDPLNATWMNDEEFLIKIENTLKPWQVQGRGLPRHLFCRRSRRHV